MRLRQIALVAKDLDRTLDDIRAVLGLDWAYDDPGVGKYGLKNGVFPVGNTFLEVVSPQTEGTTGGRLIEKRGGDGGYMVILQVRDIEAARARATAAGVRIVEGIDRPGVATSHFHPKDVGGAILSVDWMDPWDRWEWGGKGWEQQVKDEVAVGIVGAELQSSDPDDMAARWGEVLGLPVAGRRIVLPEGGELRFVEASDGRGDGVGAFDVAVRDVARARAAAEARGLVKDGTVTLGGTRVNLVAG